MSKRTTFIISDKMNNLLKSIVKNDKSNAVSKVDIIRKSIFIYAALLQETKDNKRVCILDKDSKILKEIIF